jgi:hypothetical protein
MAETLPLAPPPPPVRGQLAVIGIFALGALFGAALCFVIVHHVILPRGMVPMHDGPVPIERMRDDLGLDATQQEQVRAIVERGHTTVRGVLDATSKEIRAVLRPDQQEKFDRMRPRSPFPHGGHPHEPGAEPPH